MHTVKAKVTNIVQTSNRGTVQFTHLNKDKKADTLFFIQFDNPAEAAKYTHGEEYTVKIEATKK
jgi:hypothetical protein